jgi:hypothetical protein
MLIKFIRSITPYIAGETADFPTARAQAYIDAGVAVEVKPAAAPVEAVVDPASKAQRARARSRRQM